MKKLMFIAVTISMLFGYQLFHMTEEPGNKVSSYFTVVNSTPIYVLYTKYDLKNIKKSKIDLLNIVEKNYNKNVIVVNITNNYKFFIIKQNDLLAINRMEKLNRFYNGTISDNNKIIIISYKEIYGEIDKNKLRVFEQKICENSTFSSKINNNEMEFYYILFNKQKNEMILINIDKCNLI